MEIGSVNIKKNLSIVSLSSYAMHLKEFDAYDCITLHYVSNATYVRSDPLPYAL